jgi:hypothetical protein
MRAIVPGEIVALVPIAVRLPASAPVTRIEPCKENDASNNFWCTPLYKGVHQKFLPVGARPNIQMTEDLKRV